MARWHVGTYTTLARMARMARDLPNSYVIMETINIIFFHILHNAVAKVSNFRKYFTINN